MAGAGELSEVKEALRAQGQALQQLEGRLGRMETLLDKALHAVLLPGEEERLDASARARLALGEELLRATRKGGADDVRRLLRAGADLSVCDVDGLNALHWAACEGRADVVSLLLQHGADAEARTSFGCTALHWAACNDRSARCVRLLLAAGSDVASVNNERGTPLHCAARCGNKAATAALLDAGAPANARDAEGLAPCDVAWGAAVRDLLQAHA